MVYGFWRNAFLILGWFVLITIFLPSVFLPSALNFVTNSTEGNQGYIYSVIFFLIGAFFLWLAFRKNYSHHHQHHRHHHRHRRRINNERRKGRHKIIFIRDNYYNWHHFSIYFSNKYFKIKY